MPPTKTAAERDDVVMGLLDKVTKRTPPRPMPGTLGYRVAVALGNVNVWVYRRTGGRLGGRMAGAPVCILHHKGAKSGVERETPLLYMRDGEDVVIVASMGGSPKHPAWYHNLRANPDTEIEVGGEPIRVSTRTASPQERERLWPELVRMYASYADYQERTERTIPVVICEPRSP
jgi:deazaflavin-dependent oxidoreductase (nitroreductase family)